MSEESSFKKILLLVGTSSESHKSVRKTIALAKEIGAQIILINVVDTMLVNRLKGVTGRNLSEIEVEMEENGWKYLYHAEEKSKDQGIATLMLQETGIVQKIVLKRAKQFKIDLIVVDYPQKVSGRMRRLSVGNVDKIVQHAQCPVLVVK